MSWRLCGTAERASADQKTHGLRIQRSTTLSARLIDALAVVRPLFVQSFRLVFRVKGDTVEVIAFVHAARDFNRLFGEEE